MTCSLPLLLAMLACRAQPVPAEVAASLLSGDVEAATHTLETADPTGPLSAWQALAMQYRALDPDREAIRASEHTMLLEAARKALDGDDPAGATAALAAGLEAWPDDPDLVLLHDRMVAEASLAPPAQAAETWLALAAIHGNEPAARDHWLAQHAWAALLARYEPDVFADTRAAQRGATLTAALALLAGVDSEYYVEPDRASMITMASQRLRSLSEAPGARAAWPALAGVSWQAAPESTDLAALQGALTAAVYAGQTVALPEETVVVEWVGGALEALDPWTRAVWPAELSAWRDHHAGVRTGVGLELEARGSAVVVTRPLPGSPSWTSGLHQGDEVLRVDDLLVADVPAGDRVAVAEAALAGEPGTEVAIEVRAADGQEHGYRLTRAPVAMETVFGLTRRADNAWDPWLDEAAGLAYVRISTFREQSEPDFDALTEPLADRLSGLVLDLRGNPGGDVNAAVQIADRFVTDGILADLSGRIELETGPETDPVTGRTLAAWNDAVPGHALEGVPVVVLVDSDTASAAEILAGSLQERIHAVVVGTPTWGKGLAQGLRGEPALGYAVQVTNQVWTLPSGRRLSHELAGGGGIQPDVVLHMGAAERYQVDVLTRRREALRTHADGTPMQPTGTTPRADMRPLTADPALLLGELTLRALLASPPSATQTDAGAR